VNRKISKNKDLVERTIRNQLMLVPMKTAPARLDALYTLNETASFLWKEISDGITEETLVNRLTATYNVEEITARQDVNTILNELATIGAIKLSP
jgi:hypothetical protein